jgi:hypothetical protein
MNREEILKFIIDKIRLNFFNEKNKKIKKEQKKNQPNKE